MSGNSKQLDTNRPLAGGYNITYMYVKSIAGQAKVYIRPLQQELSMTISDGGDTVNHIHVSSIFCMCMCNVPCFLFSRQVLYPKEQCRGSAETHFHLVS